jgi:hypothetical protein
MCKSLIAIVFCTALIATPGFSQNDGVLATHFNAGLGLSNWGIPVYASYDVNVAQDINVGGGISFRRKTDSWRSGRYSGDYRHTLIGISGLGYYYFNRILEIPQEFDFYGGASLGFVIWNTKSSSNDDNYDQDYDGSGTSGLDLSLLIGGRYYFKENLGINLELGGGNHVFGSKVGLTWKL